METFHHAQASLCFPTNITQSMSNQDLVTAMKMKLTSWRKIVISVTAKQHPYFSPRDGATISTGVIKEGAQVETRSSLNSPINRCIKYQSKPKLTSIHELPRGTIMKTSIKSIVLERNTRTTQRKKLTFTTNTYKVAPLKPWRDPP